MVDLTAEMARLADSLGDLSKAAAPGFGRVIQFAAARSGEGTSTVAREFARFAAMNAQRPVWLVDLDLINAGQHAHIAARPQIYGRLGGAAGASPDGSIFFNVRPPVRDETGVVPDARYLVAHPVGGPNFWVTRFRRERLAPGQEAHITPTPEYWNVMRRHAELVVVDAPAAERSQAATLIAPFVDATVLVVAADAGDARPPAVLKSALQTAGGRTAGIFFNRVEVEPPRFLRGVMP
jgi:Mrp family chromosome partitioning ATPase